MIKINNFKINSDASEINISLEADENETVTKVLLWSNKTFQDYSLAIDLTSELEGTSNIEEFVVTANKAGVNSFTGIFFLEVETSNQDCEGCGLIGIAANLIKYNECLLDKVLNYSVCDITIDCRDNNDIINISVLLDAISICLQSSYYNEAIDIIDSLDKLCPTCSSCKTLTTYCAGAGLTFATLDNNLILI